MRGKKVTLNFITDERKYFKEAVRLGFPGDTTEEKMKNCLFTLTESTLGADRPKYIEESYQVFECTWDDSLEDAYLDKAGSLEGYEPPYRNFNGITSKFGAHFILKIDRILMKEKYRNAIINGVKPSSFPRVPVDYGYRASRIDPDVKFTDGACARLTKIPRVFLKAALTQMVKIAKEENITLIDEKALDIINDKRRQEKKK